ncbi:hypothetical protein [Adhaeribacter rhizoryzae]|uniref:Uncharacterized protein n=1 Tax=Adhaeribacter rhizoryzae TaxID=2607907 RepID=A0A5M6D4A2_9BACT|nr:hypothetical protein [Adhaeribacter rhizoryzae]KAA5541676.1 hypothetical protein F0145_20100 [Adhaeribacter rhizoryzae]
MQDQKIISLGFETNPGSWNVRASLFDLDLTNKFEPYFKEGYSVKSITHLQTIDLPDKQIIQIVVHLDKR